MAHYRQPLIRTANINGLPESDGKSLSYRQDNGSLYFYPQNRIDSMKVYLQHLHGLDVSRDVFYKMLVYIYAKCLRQVTAEYRYILRQIDMCAHYHIRSRRFTRAEMAQWAQKAQETFDALHIEESLKSDIKIEVTAQVAEMERRQQEMVAVCRSHQPVLLYGAGYMASQALFDLQEAQVDVSGVLVSKKSDNMPVFYDTPVYKAAEFIKSAEGPYFIILAMNEHNQAEVRASLSELGVPAEQIYAQPMGY